MVNYFKGSTSKAIETFFFKKLSFGKDEEKNDTYFQENMELGTWIYCW